MTANHAHTPDSGHLGKLIWETIHNDVYETDLSYAGTHNLVAKIMSSEWLAEVIASAEQRGAERGWDEGQKSGLRYAERALAAQKIGRPDLPGPPTTNPYRADRLEGDDD